MKHISIASDHSGFLLKEKLIDYIHLNTTINDIIDHGCDSEKSTDYPNYAHAVAESIVKDETQVGILICGTGNGVNMAANKHKDIRSALCWNVETAKLAREHNNANILCLPARFITVDEAFEIVKTFLNTSFLGERHERRVNKINV